VTSYGPRNTDLFSSVQPPPTAKGKTGHPIVG